MKPLPASSGDLIADRRADYAEMLFANGDHAAAVELMLGALELAPQWAMGWFRLGEFQESAGAFHEAERAWRMSLQLEPADRPGAALKLQLIGATPPAEVPPSAFVEALFDQYADKFDHALVNTLGYRVPELVEDPHLHERGAVRRVDHPDLGEMVVPHSPLRFRGSEPLPLSPSPALGEHNRLIYGEWLGLDEAEIDRLAADGTL